MFTAPGTTQPSLFAASSADTTPVVGSQFARPGRTLQVPATPPPTPEQSSIIDAYFTGHHLTVEALAGTGKTTTLRQIAAARPSRAGAYLAYNKAIADEARGKFPAAVVTGTAHSFAFRAIGQRYAHRLPGRQGRGSARLPAAEVARVLSLGGHEIGGRFFTAPALARLADATVRRFCQSAEIEIRDRHVPQVAAVQLGFRLNEQTGKPEEYNPLHEIIVPAAAKMWADLCDPNGQLWFTHDHYLKMWQLSDPILPADYVLFDEAQDANPVIAAIVAAQDHAQLIYVGDRNQQLYAWRGAKDAMDDLNGIRLPLTRSFRFGQAIAEEANQWLSMLAAPHHLVGHDPITSAVTRVDRPAAILCRTNGGAFAEVLDAQTYGRKVSLVGDGTEVRKFAFAARSLMAGRGCDLPELAAFKAWKQLVEYVDDEESGQDLKVLVNLVHRYGPGTLIDAVDQLVPTKKAHLADLIVSTAHKAKGLEWPSVRIGGDFRPPADGDPADEAELMLAYVASTRAQMYLDRGSLAWRFTGRLNSDRHWIVYPTSDDRITLEDL